MEQAGCVKLIKVTYFKISGKFPWQCWKNAHSKAPPLNESLSGFIDEVNNNLRPHLLSRSFHNNPYGELHMTQTKPPTMICHTDSTTERTIEDQDLHKKVLGALYKDNFTQIPLHKGAA